MIACCPLKKVAHKSISDSLAVLDGNGHDRMNDIVSCIQNAIYIYTL